jgi:V8-like Glu-specific endopeptidase
MRARRVAAVALVALVCSSVCACTAAQAAPAGSAASSPQPSAAAPPGSPQRLAAGVGESGPSAGGPWPATGPLFSGSSDALGDHFCTASVIDAPTRDVVLTAAHCVAAGDGTPPRTGMSFVPGYHDQVAPFGVWTVDRAVVDPAWQDGGDPAHDVAFLVVGQDGAEAPVEDLTGGYQLVTDPGPTNRVDAIGYPDFADAPSARSGVTSRMSATQLELDAFGLYDGTSGGPWLRDGSQVIAVTGGYEEGGENPDVSYASYLDDSVTGLLAELGPQPGAGDSSPTHP